MYEMFAFACSMFYGNVIILEEMEKNLYYNKNDLLKGFLALSFSSIPFERIHA